MILLKLILLIILIAFLVEGFYKLREDTPVWIAIGPASITSIVYYIVCLL